MIPDYLEPVVRLQMRRIDGSPIADGCVDSIVDHMLVTYHDGQTNLCRSILIVPGCDCCQIQSLFEA